jgi:prepilin-type N-terminal cleavage/methylation domain-containing protein
MKYTENKSLSQKGFTIVELLIATTVLSIILVLVTVMMINIGDLFYKGINQVRVQDNVRNLSTEIGQQLQLSNDTLLSVNNPIGTPSAYCIGTTRYTYLIGAQLNSSPGLYQSQHVVWRDSVPENSCTAMSTAQFSSVDPSSGGTELMTPSALLTEFIINYTGSSYNITIGEAYGGYSVLCDAGVGNDCNQSVASSNVWSPTTPSSPANVLCKGNDGDRFCATDILTSTIVQRISGS